MSNVNKWRLKMAEKQRLGKSDTKVKCKDKNIPESVKTLKNITVKVVGNI